MVGREGMLVKKTSSVVSEGCSMRWVEDAGRWWLVWIFKLGVSSRRSWQTVPKSSVVSSLVGVE